MTPDTNAELLRVAYRSTRAGLLGTQSHPHHAMIPRNKKGRPTGRLLLEAVCKSCPVKKACRSASVTLADLESRMLSGAT